MEHCIADIVPLIFEYCQYEYAFFKMNDQPNVPLKIIFPDTTIRETLLASGQSAKLMRRNLFGPLVSEKHGTKQRDIVIVMSDLNTWKNIMLCCKNFKRIAEKIFIPTMEHVTRVCKHKSASALKLLLARKDILIPRLRVKKVMKEIELTAILGQNDSVHFGIREPIIEAIHRRDPEMVAEILKDSRMIISQDGGYEMGALWTEYDSDLVDKLKMETSGKSFISIARLLFDDPRVDINRVDISDHSDVIEGMIDGFGSSEFIEGMDLILNHPRYDITKIVDESVLPYMSVRSFAYMLHNQRVQEYAKANKGARETFFDVTLHAVMQKDPPIDVFKKMISSECFEPSFTRNRLLKYLMNAKPHRMDMITALLDHPRISPDGINVDRLARFPALAQTVAGNPKLFSILIQVVEREKDLQDNPDMEWSKALMDLQTPLVDPGNKRKSKPDIVQISGKRFKTIDSYFK